MYNVPKLSKAYGTLSLSIHNEELGKSIGCQFRMITKFQKLLHLMMLSQGTNQSNQERYWMDTEFLVRLEHLLEVSQIGQLLVCFPWIDTEFRILLEHPLEISQISQLANGLLPFDGYLFPDMVGTSTGN